MDGNVESRRGYGCDMWNTKGDLDVDGRIWNLDVGMHVVCGIWMGMCM